MLSDSSEEVYIISFMLLRIKPDTWLSIVKEKKQEEYFLSHQPSLSSIPSFIFIQLFIYLTFFFFFPLPMQPLFLLWYSEYRRHGNLYIKINNGRIFHSSGMQLCYTKPHYGPFNLPHIKKYRLIKKRLAACYTSYVCTLLNDGKCALRVSNYLD